MSVGTAARLLRLAWFRPINLRVQFLRVRTECQDEKNVSIREKMTKVSATQGLGETRTAANAEVDRATSGIAVAELFNSVCEDGTPKRDRAITGENEAGWE